MSTQPGHEYEDPFLNLTSLRNGEKKLSDKQWKCISTRYHEIGWSLQELGLFLRLYSQHKFDEGEHPYPYPDTVVYPRTEHSCSNVMGLMTSAEANILIRWFYSIHQQGNGHMEAIQQAAARKLQWLQSKYPDIVREWTEWHSQHSNTVNLLTIPQVKQLKNPTESSDCKIETKITPFSVRRVCSECRSDYSDDPKALYCDICGCDLIQVKVCRECRQEITSSAKYCRYCKASQVFFESLKPADDLPERLLVEKTSRSLESVDKETRSDRLNPDSIPVTEPEVQEDVGKRVSARGITAELRDHSYDHVGWFEGINMPVASACNRIGPTKREQAEIYAGDDPYVGASSQDEDWVSLLGHEPTGDVEPYIPSNEEMTSIFRRDLSPTFADQDYEVQIVA